MGTALGQSIAKRHATPKHERILCCTLVVSITTNKRNVNTRSYFFHLSSSVLSRTISLSQALDPLV